MKSVLITGGAGFIGSNLTRDLLSRGYRVTVLDSLCAQVHGQDPSLPLSTGNLTFVRADVRSREDCLQALNGQDGLVHFAAETGTGQSMYEIEHYMDVNVGGTANLLDILANHQHTIRKMVIASSRAIYGEGKYLCREHGTVYPEARSAICPSLG